MDIFNKIVSNLKRVKELERELEKTKLERDNYHGELCDLEFKFKNMGKLQESVPEDCKKGPWCESCAFVKKFYLHRNYGYVVGGVETAYICGKSDSCSNYVQRENEED